jgi:hypothetical protein
MSRRVDSRAASLLNTLMVANVIVWDIETVPDIKSFAAANGHDGKSDDEIRLAMGDEFPKPFDIGKEPRQRTTGCPPQCRRHGLPGRAENP